MTETPSWIGEPLRARAMFALMFCGVTGLMIPGLQPLLLGGLAEAGRVAPSTLGRIATAELLVMGLTAGIAGTAFKAVHLKVWASCALVALALLDAVTPFMRGEFIIVARAIAGLPSGLLVWIAISMIARTPTPERWAGVYVTAQTIAQFVLATIVSMYIYARWGADGGFVALAVLCGLNLVFVQWLPASLAPLPAAAATVLPDLRGWAALAVNALVLGANSGTWVYVAQLSSQAHHAPGVAGEAVSLSLMCQAAGGAVAIILAGRAHWFWVMIGCVAGDLIALAFIASMPAALPFLIVSAVFGFIWLFSNPFLVPMTIEADPTRRAALLIGGAQLIGGSIAPLAASFFVTDTDARGALGFSGVSLTIAAAIVIALHLTRSRAAA